MNHSYRVVWNRSTSSWQAVCETAKRCGKSGRASLKLVAVTGVAALAGVAQAQTVNLPTGGQVVAGSAAISQSGTSMTITQGSAKAAINWQGFSVGSGNTVNFVQPSASAVALNNVLGSTVSVIQGAIKANGQVFLVNPNGVLFTPTARVEAAALVASTLRMSTSDFLAGNYTFEGASSNAVVNQGQIVATGGDGQAAAVALIAARIVNDGAITADRGAVLMGAGSNVTLDLGGPVKLRVNQGAVDALVQNGGAIQADGGLVYLTARGVNELSAAVVNNTGLVRAQTLSTGEKGEIRLVADMTSGTVVADGSLDA
ncbi:MAG: filamentous hemagglutinin N-terminal domain-containing protein, partial [Burkholderiales bacterium]